MGTSVVQNKTLESILTSIKKLLGITEEYPYFDEDIIIHINSVFATLPQICPICPKNFTISDSTTTWSDYLGDEDRIGFVKTYVYLKVRLLFDPPTGTVLEAVKQTIAELEWRLSIANNTEDEDQP